MDTITLDGTDYVKASVLAKKYKYTSDYVGQLCRAKKVDAHLVGRTWYVHPGSLQGHKDTRYIELRTSEKSIHIDLNKDKSRSSVSAPLSKKTLKSQARHYEDRVTWRRPAYEQDAADLLPEISKSTHQRSTAIAVDLADSAVVAVTSRSENLAMHSQPLPAVVLSGTLKVQSFEPVIASEVNDHDQKFSSNTRHIGSIADSREESRFLVDGPELGQVQTEVVRDIHPTNVAGVRHKVTLHRFDTVTETTPSPTFIHHEPLVRQDVPRVLARPRLTPLPPLHIARDTVGPSHATTALSVPGISPLVVVPVFLLLCALALSLVSLEITTTFTSEGRVSTQLQYTATIFEAL